VDWSQKLFANIAVFIYITVFRNERGSKDRLCKKYFTYVLML